MNSSFGESGVGGGSGDADYGANAALTELEKGLRSAKVGDQAEAIVRFPALFSQFPFPILINSGMMKLAELFKQGSNFLKLCVLRVFQRSSLHLDKVLKCSCIESKLTLRVQVTSVDEFVRKIITVINSNDPVARALTLRVLGAIAPIIAEKKTVHHKVSLQENISYNYEKLFCRFAVVWTVMMRWSCMLESSQLRSSQPQVKHSPQTCAANCWSCSTTPPHLSRSS